MSAQLRSVWRSAPRCSVERTLCESLRMCKVMGLVSVNLSRCVATRSRPIASPATSAVKLHASSPALVVAADSCWRSGLVKSTAAPTAATPVSTAPSVARVMSQCPRAAMRRMFSWCLISSSESRDMVEFSWTLKNTRTSMSSGRQAGCKSGASRSAVDLLM